MVSHTIGFCYLISRIFRVIGVLVFFFFQAEDGIRDLVRSRGLGDVYKRQGARHRAGAGGRRHL